MLAIQSFIREHGLEAAIDKWNLKINRDEHGLIQLNYHMVSSPRGVRECDECRGLILDSRDNYKAICYPFYRFYNEGEGFAADIDIEEAIISEKVDGSLIMLYYHPYLKKWQPATRGRILADGGVYNLDKSFADLFWETIANYPKAYNLFIKAPPFFPWVTLLFEMIGPENRVLTPYKNKELRLLGARYLDNSNESENNELSMLSEHLEIPRPKLYDIGSKEAVETILSDLNPVDEGFVATDYNRLVNGSFPRIKIKNPRYLALRRLLGAGEDELLNSKRVLQLIKTGEIEEIISYFPEYEEQIMTVKGKFGKLIEKVEFDYSLIEHLGGDKKIFAEKAKKMMAPHALFALNNGKVDSIKDFVYNMKDEQLLSLFERV